MNGQTYHLVTKITFSAILFGCVQLAPQKSLGCSYVWCMPQEDQNGLTKAVEIAKNHTKRYSDDLCVGASIDLSTALKKEASNPNSVLSGWVVQIINGRIDMGGRGSHNGVRLKSARTGNNYYIDSFHIVTLCRLDVVETNDVGEEIKWRTDGCFTAGGDYVPDDDVEDKLCNLPERDKEYFYLVVGSYDPNDKIGSQGVGEAQFISGEEPLRYSIFFENLETATAPAQEVVITDQLAVDAMELRTLSLGEIAFGDTRISPPVGLWNYTTEVDLRPNNNLIVQLDAALDIFTGRITWRFSSIDPDTGEPPEDPLAGFLPPNITPPEGEGHVLFTVMPKEGLPTDTVICNQAEIVFDTNEPIVTPEWCNTLDNDVPESEVLALATTQPSLDFEVHWTGTDVGAGIRDHTIYVSEDGAPYTPWLTNTPDNMGVFTGENGKTYGFYSVARDLTGNVEIKEAIAEATTTVAVVINEPPNADAAIRDVPECTNTDEVTVTLDGTGSSDPDGDVLTYTWTGPFGEVTGDVVTVTLSVGQHTITLTVDDGNGGVDSDTLDVTVESCEINCDINGDGKFDLKDKKLFQEGCKKGTATWACDLNEDGRFNNRDRKLYRKECRKQKKNR